MLFAVCKEAMRSYPSANSNTKQKPNIGHPYRKNSLWPPTYDDLSITLPYTSYFGDCLNMGFQLSFYVPTTSRHILTPLMKSLWHCLQPTGKKEKKEEEMSLITALQRDCFLIRAPSFTGSSTNRKPSWTQILPHRTGLGYAHIFTTASQHKCFCGRQPLVADSGDIIWGHLFCYAPSGATKAFLQLYFTPAKVNFCSVLHFINIKNSIKYMWK